eukprot:TRINITY_DN37697_c0_g1_i4.p1 TRINITY_DN37697_c0_g1~~TRINITY_DN37697_c0_g1_i4.p1  ORF type:complete len:316 (-),score=27.97 TRINITY_DN37697_c0_g1_i4:53-970(-)
MDIEDKVFIITGSAGGLGKAFAEKLLRRGARVCLSDVKVDLGAETLQEFSSKYGEESVLFQKLDVTNESNFRSVWTETEKYFGNKVYCLVNNAGVMGEREGWKLCMDINLTAIMQTSNVATQKMGKSSGGEGGTIINVSSILGLFCAQQPKGFPYNVSKSGVVTLTRCMGSKDFYEKENVRVLCLCPSVAQTPILDACTDKEIAKMSKDVGGIMSPDHVANAFMTLLDDGKTGDVMSVWVNSPPYYIPDTGMGLFIFYTTCAMILSWVPGVKSVRPWLMLVTLMGIFFSWYLMGQGVSSVYRSIF